MAPLWEAVPSLVSGGGGGVGGQWAKARLPGGAGKWPRSRCGVAGGQRWPGRGRGAPPLRVWPVGSGPPGLEVFCDTGHGIALKGGASADVAPHGRGAFVARLEGNFVF